MTRPRVSHLSVAGGRISKIMGITVTDPSKTIEVAIGLDIGQKRDPTAICVAEIDPREQGKRTDIHFLIRHLERLPLGTPYPQVAERFAQLVSRVRTKTDRKPTIFVDATGVGQPVVDIMRDEVQGGLIVEVYFTHGDRRTETKEHHTLKSVSLGKAFLVSRLQALLQTGRLHLPRNAESAALTEELLNYEIRIDDNANDRYGAFRVGTHDDLVTALGLAVQVDEAVRRFSVVWGMDRRN